jgi:phage tail-like protein
MASAQTSALQVFSAPRFFIQSDQIPPLGFAELKGISSQVEHHEYIFNDEKGNTQHTKQFGKTKPPTVVLVRALDADIKPFFEWHEMARVGDPAARTGVTITVQDASGNVQVTYMLENAWLTKLEIGNAKAGSTDSLMVTMTIECDKILTS